MNFNLPVGSAVFWFRRDLRLHDNHGLHQALSLNKEIVPLFIFDINILKDLHKKDPRIEFMVNALKDLQAGLVKHGSSLVVQYGDPEEIFKRVRPKRVYTNEDYEPYARKRDQRVEKVVNNAGGTFHSFKDQVIFEKNEIVKSNGKPFTIFTPYMKKWKRELHANQLQPFTLGELTGNLWQSDPLPVPGLRELDFIDSNIKFPAGKIDLGLIRNYDKIRNYPALGTSKLSVHLRFGTISIRELTRIALENNETFLNELIWRNFFITILWHFPYVTEKAFKPGYDLIEWENDVEKFKRWCHGNTGFPLVDAGMRELNATGYMHNRVRMVVASFLCKNLHVDWRWGEAYFAKKLLDYDLAVNNGNWQWAAGTGCDAAPYFRVFNPDVQQQKFDPKGVYISKWIPELGTNDYPARIVDLPQTRQKTLELYKNALAR